MNETIAIRISGLTKHFDGHCAVDHLDLDVQQGELFGLVGPDGAGKTTVMRLLAAIMTPSSGDALIAGHSILKEGEAIKEKIGYMSQRFGLYEELTVMENILFYADLYDVPTAQRSPRIQELLGFSNLTPFSERPAGNLSGGMKQKLGLACALIHKPEVLLLDEPTNGVDPVSRRDFWRILYSLLTERITVFVSTAYLDEAERCTRIGLIHHGSLLMVDEPARIRKSIDQPMIEVWCDDARTAADMLQSLAGVLSVEIYGDKLHIALEKAADADTVLNNLRLRGVVVKAHRTILPSLEDIFIARLRES
jgi:ABC-2 type transport system ATP-binding protein